MQLNHIHFQALSVGLKIVLLALIIMLVVSILLSNFLFYLKGICYKLFQQGAILVLNYQTRDYAILKSTGFVLRYTDKDKELAPLVLEMAEDYLSRVEQILGFNHSEQRIPLVLYADEESLNKCFGWTGDKSAVGVYWAGTIRLVSPRAWADVLPEDTAELKRIFQKEGPLAHELTHLLVDETTGGNYPRWLTEGLAQYVEEKISGFTLSEPASSSKAALYSFSALDGGFDEQPDQLLAYWQSFQAVRHLLEQYGREKMINLLECLKKGEHFSAAFEKSYALSFDDFAKKSSF
jgi:hypothetical protein